MFIYIIFIILGLVVLAYGSRLAIFGAGVGALLGIGILRILPGAKENLLWLAVPIVLAVLFAFGAGIAKGLIGLITLALGALAGGAITLTLLDLFSLDWGIMNWGLALIGAVIGAAIASRFKGWAIIILASTVGALLCVRGLQMIFTGFDGFFASLVGVILLVGGTVYQGGLLKKK